MRYVSSDGGRWAAGLCGSSSGGDCVASAITIASGRSYGEIYALLEKLGHSYGHSRFGINTKKRRFRQLMRKLGFRLVKTRFGRCTTRLRSYDLPLGRLMVTLHGYRYGHATAVIDRVLYDDHDSSRNGQALVTAYWFTKGRR
jgi:hypothetical protein